MKKKIRKRIARLFHFDEVKTIVCDSVVEESLLGKRIFVAGGTSGIGFAVAAKCTACGADVVITGRGDDKEIEETAHLLGPHCYGCSWDICNVGYFGTGFERVKDLLGGEADILFANAGIYIPGPRFSSQDYDSVLDVNLKGNCLLIATQVERWVSSDRQGVIVATGSNRGLMPDAGPYGTGKAALHSFVQGIARDYASQGIRANVVAPGMTATDINGIDPSGNLYTGIMKAPRVIRPEEIAEIVAFLMSDRASCVNGAVIPCDLGESLR